MEFKDYLLAQMKLHPSFQPRDIVKQAYQAAYGAEHLLTDTKMAYQYFMKEYNEVEEDSSPLYEQIAPNVFRVNLSGWKKTKMPPEWLVKMFVLSSGIPGGGSDAFEDYLRQADDLVISEKTLVSPESWRSFIVEYRSGPMGAVHHSTVYHDTERPAYRVVSGELIRLLPVLEKIALRGEKYTVIALDGRAASGKTTMARELAYILDAPAVHMDDFFVPPALRSDERYAQPGGNVHYERFCEEVLPFIGKNEPFSYRIFDCSIMDYNGTAEIPSAQYRIVEGSYSCHPKFGSYADIRVFSDIDPKTQIKRVEKRDGSEYAEMFRTKWIPLEEKYFNAFDIRKTCDIIV